MLGLRSSAGGANVLDPTSNINKDDLGALAGVGSCSFKRRIASMKSSMVLAAATALAAVASMSIVPPALPQVATPNAPSVPTAPVIAPAPPPSTQSPAISIRMPIRLGFLHAGRNACRPPVRQARPARNIAMTSACELDGAHAGTQRPDCETRAPRNLERLGGVRRLG